MTIGALEHRVAVLEKQMGHLLQKVEGGNPSNPNAWINEIRGTFKDDSTYRKAARLGRQWRESYRPASSRARKVPRK